MALNVGREKLISDLACYGCESRYECLLNQNEVDKTKDRCNSRIEDAEDFVNEYFD